MMALFTVSVSVPVLVIQYIFFSIVCKRSFYFFVVPLNDFSSISLAI